MNPNCAALRPPMGWNSYDYYDTTVTEAEVLQNAAFMAGHLLAFGWEYVVVDIQWYAYGTGSMRERFQYIPFGRVEMDEFGRLLPCPDKFPSSVGGAGFRPLAEQLHAMGLKFGIHIMRGIPREAAHRHLPVQGTDVTADMVADPSSICPWNPDMYGVRHSPAGQAYYDSLLRLYAEWGVDFIKCDDICSADFGPERRYLHKKEVEMLHLAIERCGRPMVLSLSPGPAQVTESWHYSRYANMWRITDDFWDSWPPLLDMFDRCQRWQDHVRPGSWPDCDMLPLGRIGRGFAQERQTGLTRPEQQSMMALWCIFHSPLMLGAEMTTLDDWTLSLLQNRQLLRLQQGNFLSRQVLREDGRCVWAAVSPENGEYYVAIFNLAEQTQTLDVSLSVLQDVFPDMALRGKTCTEVFSGKGAQPHNPGGSIPPHGVLLFHIR